MSDFAEGYAAGQGNSNNCGGYGMGGFGEWIWIIVLFALWQNGGFGFGGYGGGYGRGDCATQADLAMGFNNSAVLGGVNDLKLGQAGIQQTLCQGFNGVNTTVLQGFNGVEKGFCDTRHAIYNSTRDIIDNANANNRAILDFLTQDKIATLTAENQNLKFAASQSAQNAYLTATIDASRAELIRRLGAECPMPAYVVQPPQPVTFPTNGCGQFSFAGYNNGGCGCGC